MRIFNHKTSQREFGPPINPHIVTMVTCRLEIFHLYSGPVIRLYIRHLSQPTFCGGWPLKSCTHTGIYPSVSGPSAVKRKPRKVPNKYDGL